MRVLLVDSNHPVLHETLSSNGFSCDCYWDRPTEKLLAILPQYEAVVIRSRFRITKEIIDQCPLLRCIGRVGAGMENIDHQYARSRGIVCVSAPEGNRDAVGEHALGMLLMLLNHLKKADAEVRQGTWLRAENRGTEIAGKTVGIIGYGHMGSSFAKKLSALDCRILVHDKYKSGFHESYIEECSLKEIQEQADIISIHLPLTEETTYYLNADFFNACKKAPVIINTARGKCLNTSDLADALKSGIVSGACLDVLEYESNSFEQIPAEQLPEPFRFIAGSDKVILSPHIAGWTHESNYKMSRIIAEKMISAFSGQ